MALKHCPECGKELSTAAAACPHCGAPLRRARVTPWTVIGWLLALLLAIWMLNGFVQGYRDGLRANAEAPATP